MRRVRSQSRYEPDWPPMRVAAGLMLVVLAGACRSSASSAPVDGSSITRPPHRRASHGPPGSGGLIGPRLPEYARITDVEVSGRGGDVESNLRSQLIPGARLCFEHALSLGMAEPGTLSLAIDIDSNGDVSDARVDKFEPALGSAVVTCVVGRAKRAHFTGIDAGRVKVPNSRATSRPDGETRPSGCRRRRRARAQPTPGKPSPRRAPSRARPGASRPATRWPHRIRRSRPPRVQLTERELVAHRDELAQRFRRLSVP